VQIHVAPPRGVLDAGMLDEYRELGADQVILPLFARDADKLRKRADALALQTLGPQ
jgi:hypothetical protein